MDMIQVYKILMTSLVKDLFEYSDQKLGGLSKKLKKPKDMKSFRLNSLLF